MKHKTLLSTIAATISLLVFAGGSVFASMVTTDQASLAVCGWFSQTSGISGFGMDESSVKTVETVASEDGDPLFHVVRLENGSTVITSTDTGVEPIIAFGADNFAPEK